MNARSFAAPAACLAVAGGLALGFSEIGSPAHNRSVALDERRVTAIEEIAEQLTGVSRDAPGRMPAPEFRYRVRPEAWDQITYTRTGRHSYRLCATFDLPSDVESDGNPGSASSPIRPGARATRSIPGRTLRISRFPNDPAFARHRRHPVRFVMLTLPVAGFIFAAGFVAVGVVLARTPAGSPIDRLGFYKALGTAMIVLGIVIAVVVVVVLAALVTGTCSPCL